MKHTILSFTCILLLMSCESREPVVSNLSCTKNKIQFTSLANTDTMHIYSNIAWTTSVDAEWITINPSNGKGDTIVTISSGEVNAPASATITFTADTKLVKVSIERVPEYDKKNGIGRFSVSDNKTVSFAPGNLKYSPTTEKWSFADEQYKYLGSANQAFKEAEEIDLFCWGSGEMPLYVRHEKNYVDWGVNIIDDYPANTWRCISSGEFAYIRKYRPNAEKLFGFGNIAGIKGMFIFPDDLTNLAGIAPLKQSIDYSIGREWAGGYERTNHTSIFNDNAYTKAQWVIMEKAGVVFLPAACQYEAWYNPWHFLVVGYGEGHYWYNTGYYNEDAYAASLEFRTDYVKFEYHTDKMRGNSVRLVK